MAKCSSKTHTLHNDVQCGPDCKKLTVGDRVVGIMKVAEYQRGTWTEMTMVGLLIPFSACGLLSDTFDTFAPAHPASHFHHQAPESDVCLIEDDEMSFVDASAVAMGAFVASDMVSVDAVLECRRVSRKSCSN